MGTPVLMIRMPLPTILLAVPMRDSFVLPCTTYTEMYQGRTTYRSKPEECKPHTKRGARREETKPFGLLDGWTDPADGEAEAGRESVGLVGYRD